MTLRATIEAAARAIGLQSLGEYNEFCGLKTSSGWFCPHLEPRDMFALVTGLHITVEHNHPAQEHHPWVLASVETADAVYSVMEDVPNEAHRPDALRLAVLRCAAACAQKLAA